MDQRTQEELIQRVRQLAEARSTHMVEEEGRLPVEPYLSAERLTRERVGLFQGLPIAVAHASQLAEPGDYLTHDGTGLPLLVVRQGGGGLAAFLNVCRHRGTRLVQDEQGRRRRAFVCPYHGWTYDEEGRLRNVPHEVGFPSTRVDAVGLVRVPVEERLGLVWVLARPAAALELSGFLAPVEAELEGFGLSRHVVYRTASARHGLNWKIAIEVFLEGYHLKYAHQASIYPLFFDNLSLTDRREPHVRVVFPKRTLTGLSQRPAEGWNLRAHANVLYFLFPNTLVLVQPDFISLMSAFPGEDPDHCVLRELHLLEKPPDSEKATRYWDKNIGILIGAVAEDLKMGESIQAGLRSGANGFLRLGRFEQGLGYFHDSLERALAASERR